MEHLKGDTLSARIRSGKSLGVGEAVDIVLQACEAVGEAHRRGIVHRDLKPKNLFLVAAPGPVPRLKVLDFGIARTFDPNMEGLTNSHAFLGTPAYAAPEQLRASHSVDGRADIWALGVILYESLVGTRPFAAETHAEVASQILRDAPIAPRRARPEIPASLERIILKCLEKVSDRRFATIGELASALESFAPETARRTLDHLAWVETANDVVPKAREAAAPVSLGTTLTQAAVAGGHAPGRSRSRSKLAFVGVAAALTLGVVAALVVVANGRRGAVPTVVAVQSNTLPVPAISAPVTIAPLPATEFPAAPAASVAQEDRVQAAPRPASPSPHRGAAGRRAGWVDPAFERLIDERQ
jgi:serine/threonine-protein kinase